ncbi:MAG: hypothetical protein JW864_01350 [Spirochaetes bacterium]|nr:hypothetical protein [Spirochaetota bacterium]
MTGKLLIITFCIAVIVLFSGNASALDIKKIELIGNTIDLEVSDEIKNTEGELSRNDIKAIGIKITNEYHDKGYTTSYVDKLVRRKDGTLEIHIKESVILGVNIIGADDENKKKIEYAFNMLTATLFNKYKTEKVAGIIKNRFNLKSVRIYPVNYNDTGDVFLSINITEKSKGEFYGGIGFEPVYGIAPELGYYRPFTNAAVDLYSKAGYRDNKFRRAEGDLKLFIFTGNSASGIYIGTKASMFLDEWESRDYEYKRTSLSPVIGYRSIYQYAVIDIYMTEIISDIKNYENNDEKFRDYDTRGTIEIGLLNSSSMLSEKDATKLAIAFSSGINDLNDKYYIISSGELKTAFSPFSWMRIVPNLYSYYTSSGQRYFWQYIYDKRLLGFFNDYTTSKWKNSAGLEIELELIPQFLYTGPFANTGYFLDEFDEWKNKTGTGVKASFEFSSVYLEIYYAWDASGSPSKGGLSILAGGRF